MVVEWLKWPRTPYRSTPMTRLGDDEHGTWLFAPLGAAASYAGRGAAPLPVNFLTVVPDGDAGWIATWMWGNADVDIDLYVDIVHAPSWTSPGRLEVVDLDLDVIRLRDGTVFLDDEDEFAANATALGYPADVVAGARAAADHALAAVAARTPPFGEAPRQHVAAVSRALTVVNRPNSA